jgi:hypothetical protein
MQFAFLQAQTEITYSAIVRHLTAVPETRESGSSAYSAKQQPQNHQRVKLYIVTLGHIIYESYALWMNIKATRYENSNASIHISASLSLLLC